MRTVHRPPPPSPAPQARVRDRLRGVDAARAIAIIGMVMVHIGPVEVPGIAGTAYTLPYGRASLLFATLAGIGVSLLAGDRSPRRIHDARLRLMVRAAMLFPLGLALQAMGTGIAVILQYYAIYFLVGTAAIRLSDRRLLGLAAALVMAGPLILFLAIQTFPAWFDSGGDATIAQPVALTRDLLLTGYYPLLTWSAPLLFGMWLGRRDLRATPIRWRMVAAGAIVAGIAYASAWGLGDMVGGPADPDDPAVLVTAEAHSQMPLWLIGSTAVAVAVIGGSLLVTSRLPRTTWPLAAMGQLALTIYTGQLIVLAVAPGLLFRDDVPGAALVVASFTAVALVAATLWRAVLPRGPLEAAFHAPWALAQRSRRRAGQARTDTEPQPSLPDGPAVSHTP